MKSKLKIKIIAFCIISSSFKIFSQAQNTRIEAFTKNNLYFYGYDFSRCKLVEAKRIDKGNEIKIAFLDIINIMNTHFPEERYKKILKKDTLIFSQTAVNKLNAKIKAENTVDPITKNIIPKDSLQTIINQYEIKETIGIGLVQIMECLYRPKKEVSIWYVLFDINTRKILDAKEMFNYDSDSYHGLSTYWGVGIGAQLGFYKKYYLKESRNK